LKTYACPGLLRVRSFFFTLKKNLVLDNSVHSFALLNVVVNERWINVLVQRDCTCSRNVSGLVHAKEEEKRQPSSAAALHLLTKVRGLVHALYKIASVHAGDIKSGAS
jgi:hypothetical protein